MLDVKVPHVAPFECSLCGAEHPPVYVRLLGPTDTAAVDELRQSWHRAVDAASVASAEEFDSFDRAANRKGAAYLRLITYDTVETPPTIETIPKDPEHRLRCLDDCTLRHCNSIEHRYGVCRGDHSLAIVRPNGDRFWYRNGKLHRNKGPAADCQDGYQVWYRDGVCHRADGPAIRWPSGREAYCLDGKLMSQQDFARKQNR